MYIKVWSQLVSVLRQDGSKGVSLKAVFVEAPNGVDSSKSVQFVYYIGIAKQKVVLTSKVETVFFVDIEIVLQIDFEEGLVVCGDVGFSFSPACFESDSGFLGKKVILS